MMNKLLLGILTLILAFNMQAQNFEDLHFGTDSTFEVITWNLEWFPKNGQITINYVSQIIEALDVDVIALQEIDEKNQFSNMVDNLEGWEGYYVDNNYLGLAYIYKSSTVEPLEIKEILTSKNRELPRSPYVMGLRSHGLDFILINNHFKCCGDGYLDHTDLWDEETRRIDGCILLEQYINDNHPFDRVILLGDLNDNLTDIPENNVFSPFLDKPEKYIFTDMQIAAGSSTGWSYPSWPSHLDHIMINDVLYDNILGEDAVVTTIKLDNYFSGGFNEYDDDVSDHRPVGLKVKLLDNFGISENLINNHHLKVYPNPIYGNTTISIDVNDDNTRVEIFNKLGVIIDIIQMDDNKSIQWNAQHLPPGMYIARLISENQVISIRKIVKQ